MIPQLVPPHLELNMILRLHPGRLSTALVFLSLLAVPASALAAGTTTEGQACSYERMVGQRVSGNQCPMATPPNGTEPGWITARVFPYSSLGTPDAGAAYCGYTWTAAEGEEDPPDPPDPPEPPDDPPPDLEALPFDGNLPPSEWLNPDCHVVAPMAPNGVILEETGETLRSSFQEQIERVGDLPDWSGPATRVAVLDTYGLLGGQSDHGGAMAYLIRDLACQSNTAGDADCYAATRSYLALDLEMMPDGSIASRPILGGFFGYQAGLARSIFKAVDHWRKAGSANGLIINLPLGWDVEYNTTASGDPRDSARAVREAIEYARCEGALVIVAVGNKATGTAPASGPTAPAIWEEELTSCPTGTSTYEPLVYAVGGVDGNHSFIANTREGGRARLAGPAMQVAVAKLDGSGGFDRWLATGSGSSFGAAGVSAIAAILWRIDPTKTAAEIMDTIYEMGHPLESDAEVCLGGGTCDQTAVASLCASVDAAFDAVCASSSAPAECAGVPSSFGCRLTGETVGNPIWTAAETANIDAQMQHTIDASSLATPYSHSACLAPVMTLKGQSVASPCPQDMHPNLVQAPWAINAESPPDPCGGDCSLLSDGSTTADLYAHITADPGGNLSNAHLELTTDAGLVTDRFDIKALLGQVNPGQSFVLRDLPLSGTHDRAQMVFDLVDDRGDTWSVVSEVLVQPLAGN